MSGADGNRTPGLLLAKAVRSVAAAALPAHIAQNEPLEPEMTPEPPSPVSIRCQVRPRGSRRWAVSAMSMPSVAAMSQMRARLAERYSVDS